jgi:hypothetical protein
MRYHLVCQGIQVAPALNLLRNNDLTRGTFFYATQVGHDEIVNRPLPASHACAHDFVIDVLGERGPFLPELGVAWRGQVVHGIQKTGVSLKGQAFCHLGLKGQRALRRPDRHDPGGGAVTDSAWPGFHLTGVSIKSNVYILI